MNKLILFMFVFVCLSANAQNLGGQDVVKNEKDENKPSTIGAIQDGVFFVEPKNGAVVGQKFKVKFGVHGMRIKPAGEIEVGTGHHHLIIQPATTAKKDLGIVEKDVVPKDETHIHYGKGQEEDEINLKPGKYKLTLQFADGVHLSYGPKWAKTISITVK